MQPVPRDLTAEAVRSGSTWGQRASGAGWGPLGDGNHAPRDALFGWAGVQPAGGRVCARTVGTDAEATGRRGRGWGWPGPAGAPLTCPGSHAPASGAGPHPSHPGCPAPEAGAGSQESGRPGLHPRAEATQGGQASTPHPTGEQRTAAAPTPARISPAQRLQAAQPLPRPVPRRTRREGRQPGYRVGGPALSSTRTGRGLAPQD